MAEKKGSRKDENTKSDWSPPGEDKAFEDAAFDREAAPSVPAVDAPSTKDKDLTVTTPEEAKAAGTVTTGLADRWLCVAKAANEAEGWMKSTKAMQVGAGGCLIQVTTQQKNPDGTWAIAEAVCFAHGVSLVEVDGQGRFLT